MPTVRVNAPIAVAGRHYRRGDEAELTEERVTAFGKDVTVLDGSSGKRAEAPAGKQAPAPADKQVKSPKDK